MSHYKIKTTYNSEGPYGSIEEHTIFAHHNLSCDYVTFYDEDGKYIMSIPDTIDNNMLDAINKLYGNPFVTNSYDKLIDGVKYMTNEDKEKCKL